MALIVKEFSMFSQIAGIKTPLLLNNEKVNKMETFFNNFQTIPEKINSTHCNLHKNVK